MTKDEIYVRKELEKVYPQLLINVKNVCGKGYKQWGEDLLPVAITFFLEKPLEQQLRTIREGKLENFITWIMNIQLKSNSSYHFSMYRKPMARNRELWDEKYDYMSKEDFIVENFNEELYQCVEEQLNKIPEEYKEAILGITFRHQPMTYYSEKSNLVQRRFIDEVEKYVKQIEKNCEECL